MSQIDWPIGKPFKFGTPYSSILEMITERASMDNNQRNTQFKGFAKALIKELDAVMTITYASLDKAREAYELAIARRAYDLVAHTVGYSLEYLHECGREMPGGMKTRIVPSIPDLTELPKDQE